MRVRLKHPEATKSVMRCKALALEKKEKGEASERMLQAVAKLESYDGAADLPVSTLHAALEVYKSLSSPQDPEAASRRFWEEVLQGSKVAFPEWERRKQETEERLKGKEKWRQELRVRDEERRYNSMVGNVAWGGPKEKDIETRAMYQTSMGLNMVAAAATVGFILYYCLGNAFNQESIRILVAVLGGFAMMMIELVLYIIRTFEAQEFEAKRIRNEKLGRIGKPLPIPPPQPIFNPEWWGAKRAKGKGKAGMSTLEADPDNKIKHD